MLLAEALGDEAFRERVKIYATDVDEDALAAGPPRRLRARQVEGVPAGAARALLRRGRRPRYMFRQGPAPAVIFGRHDLVQDPPISRVDLLVCRNTLMYFNAETQARILASFHFALRDDGFLFLGKSEMLLTHAHLFVPVDLKRRVFAKSPRGRRERCRRRRRRRERDGGRRRRSCATRPSSRRRSRSSSSTRRARSSLANHAGARRCSGSPQRPRAAAPGPRALVPAARAALAHRPGAQRAARRRRRATSSGTRPRRAARRSTSARPAAAARRRRVARHRAIAFTDVTRYTRLHERAQRRSASSRRPTRSCSRRSRSSRPRTRSSSRRTRSSRRRTRSSSRRTRSSRR